MGKQVLWKKKKNVIKIPKEIQKIKQEACACYAKGSMRLRWKLKHLNFPQTLQLLNTF